MMLARRLAPVPTSPKCRFTGPTPSSISVKPLFNVVAKPRHWLSIRNSHNSRSYFVANVAAMPRFCLSSWNSHNSRIYSVVNDRGMENTDDDKNVVDKESKVKAEGGNNETWMYKFISKVTPLHLVFSLICFFLFIRFILVEFRKPLMCFYEAVLALPDFQLLAQSVTGVFMLVNLWGLYLMRSSQFFPIPLLSILYMARTYGVPMKLVLFGSIGMAAISEVGKTYLMNILFGLHLRVGKLVSDNDYIRVGTVEGFVEKIDMLDTLLVNARGWEVRIPNSYFFSKEWKKFPTVWRVLKIKVPFRQGCIDKIDEIPHLMKEALTDEFASEVDRTSCELVKIDALVVEFIFKYSLSCTIKDWKCVLETEKKIKLQLYKKIKEAESCNYEKVLIERVLESE